jgi:radical SAM superfamily enzyme YgiQ (UPF0313 family)
MVHDHYGHWYEGVYPQLLGAGLWLRGGEPNTLAPEAWTARPFRVLLARLSTYFDTGYSFTHQLLYQLAAGVEGVFPDLAYLPPKHDLAAFAASDVPWWLGTQTKRGPRSFDLLGISNSIQQELLNLPTLLQRSGLPLSKAERLERPDLPLVLLGGANALYTSVLWTSDPAVDAVFVGEDDGAIVRLLSLARDAKAAGANKAEILAALAQVDGLIEPDRPRRTTKAFSWSLDRAVHLEEAPVYHLADAAGSAHLQISEGCPCFCSFCAESWDRKPYRERKAAVLRERALALKAAMGLEEIELYSFNFNMHSGFYQVLWDLVPHFRRVGLKSQRFDLLAHDPQMVAFQHLIEKSSLTCGLEGISPRLRAYLHKNLETDDLHTSLQAIFESRARALKVFLIATGLEGPQDYEAFSDLLGHIAEVRRALGARTRLLFSMTPLVRFPWTPLEYEDAPPAERYADVIERVARRVRNHGFEFRESAELDEYLLSQWLVRASDPRIYRALLAALERTGFVYYREVTPRFREAFEEALREQGLEPSDLLRGHDFEQGEAKPWTAVATGVKRDFLWQEVLRARSFVEIDYCLGRAWTKAKCFRCGGCPSKEHVRDIVLARQPRDYDLEAFAERVRSARADEREVALDVEIGAPARGLPRKSFGVMLARALMRVEPRLVESYAGFVRSLEGGDGTRPCYATGADLLTLRLRSAGLPLLATLVAEPDRLAAVERELRGWGRLVGFAAPDAASATPRHWTIESPYAFVPRPYLEAQALTGTLRRMGPTRYAYEWSAKAVRRDVLRALSWEQRDSDTVVELTPGHRFELETFLATAFALPHPDDWVRLTARASLRPAAAVPVLGP